MASSTSSIRGRRGPSGGTARTRARLAAATVASVPSDVSGVLMRGKARRSGGRGSERRPIAGEERCHGGGPSTSDGIRPSRGGHGAPLGRVDEQLGRPPAVVALVGGLAHEPALAI